MTNYEKTFLLDTNAQYFGWPVIKMMEKAGEGIADFVEKKYGQNKKIGIFCGLGNNGGDGLVAARYLAKNNEVTVYLVGGACQDCKTLETKVNCQKLGKLKSIKFVQKAKAKDITQTFDVVIDTLLGVGAKGSLKEPFASVVKKINKQKARKVSVDIETPGFKAEEVLAMHYAKSKNAKVIDIGISKEIEQRVGPGEVKLLYKPNANSHKGQNGKLLIIGGSERYHGAPLMAAKMASKIVDMVYFYSTGENQVLCKKMKSGLCEFISVLEGELDDYADEADCILIGPGLSISKETKELTEYILKKYKTKKIILDADSLKVIKPNLLQSNFLVLPHEREFESLFKVKIKKNLSQRVRETQKAAKKYNCHIVLKGKDDVICSPKSCKVNAVGHPGLTKGGTGDVLAGMVAGFSCKDDLFLAGSAAIFLNGLAGQRLAKKVSHYYSATDLIAEIPRAIKWCEGL